MLEAVRQRSQVPVIMLTARCEMACLHQALVEGADDYVKKPFTTAELMARIRAKLRRTEAGTSQASKSPILEEILRWQESVPHTPQEE